MKRGWIILVLVVVIAIAISIYEGGGLNLSGDSDTGDPADGTDGGIVASIQQLFDAITQQENVAAFHNNPAALTAPAADEVGADYTPNTTGGVVVNFPTLQDGISAGMAFLQNFVQDHSDLTLIQGLATYINGPNAASTIAGAATGIYPASVTNYANGVASALHVSITDTLGSIFGSN